jgi:hypothetical protein
MEEWERNGLDPNSAELDELIKLPGVGRVLAERIITHRPYDSTDALRRVPGLGGATLLRIEPYLALDMGTRVEPVERGGERPPEEEQRVEVGKPSPVRRVEPAKKMEITRAGLLWMLAGTFVLSVVVAVGLSLAILGGINRTLDIGEHAAVQRMSDEISQIRLDLDSFAGRVEGISRRMEAVEGLSGRVAAMEREFATLETEVGEAMMEMDDIRIGIDGISTDLKAVEDQVDIFQRFLTGLNSVLSELPIPQPGDATPQP